MAYNSEEISPRFYIMNELTQIEHLSEQALGELAGVANAAALRDWRVRYLGKKSQLTAVLRRLGELSLAEKKAVGARANEVKAGLEAGLAEKEQALRKAQVASLAGNEALDVTLPGRTPPLGRLHPVTRIIYEISDIFASMGFQVLEGPEVELDY